MLNQEAKRFLGPAGICPSCKKKISLYYCRDCDDFFHFGHEAECDIRRILFTIFMAWESHQSHKIYPAKIKDKILVLALSKIDICKENYLKGFLTHLEIERPLFIFRKNKNSQKDNFLVE